MKTLTGSQRYLGKEGCKYFNFQNKGGDQRGRINVRKFAPYIQPNDRVLDFGCGGGWLLRNLECKHRIGVEINPTAHVVVKRNNIEVHETLADIANGSVDVVISNHALEHVPAPLTTLIELRRVLVPGGRIVLAVPIDDWRAGKTFTKPDINNHLYTWSPKLLGNLLCEAGFDVNKIWVYTHAWPPRYWQRLNKWLPVWLFDFACWFTALRLKRRQIMVVAEKIETTVDIEQVTEGKRHIPMREPNLVPIA